MHFVKDVVHGFVVFGQRLQFNQCLTPDGTKDVAQDEENGVDTQWNDVPLEEVSLLDEYRRDDGGRSIEWLLWLQLVQS